MNFENKILSVIVTLGSLNLNVLGQAQADVWVNQTLLPLESKPLIMYPHNEKASSLYKEPVTAALAYYPELKNTRIVFVEKSIKTSAACRPSWKFIFQGKKNREYKIYINNNPERIKGAMFCDIPVNAQIGLIGHELGHIVDYSKRSFLGIVGLGLKYLFIKSRSHIEKRIDSITIAHNLGWHVYEFDDFVLNCSKVSNAYKDYKRKVYYKPEELLQLIEVRTSGQ